MDENLMKWYNSLTLAQQKGVNFYLTIYFISMLQPYLRRFDRHLSRVEERLYKTLERIECDYSQPLRESGSEG